MDGKPARISWRWWMQSRLYERWTYLGREHVAGEMDAQIYMSREALTRMEPGAGVETCERSIDAYTHVRDWLLNHARTTRRLLREECIANANDESRDPYHRSAYGKVSQLLEKRCGSVRMCFLNWAEEEYYVKNRNSERLAQYWKVFGLSKPVGWRELDDFLSRCGERKAIAPHSLDGIPS